MNGSKYMANKPCQVELVQGTNFSLESLENSADSRILVSPSNA